MLFQKIRTLNLDRMDVDEAIELVTFARQATGTYDSYKVPTPQWLSDGIAMLDGEIKRRRRDMLEARQREIKATLTTLKTREEKRSELEAELAQLNDAVGAP